MVEASLADAGACTDLGNADGGVSELMHEVARRGE